MEDLGHISERSKGFSYNIDYSVVLTPMDKKLLQQIHSHSSFLRQECAGFELLGTINFNDKFIARKNLKKQKKNIQSVGASGDRGIEPLHELEKRAKSENY